MDASVVQFLMERSGWSVGRRVSSEPYRQVLQRNGYSWFAAADDFLTEFGGVTLGGSDIGPELSKTIFTLPTGDRCTFSGSPTLVVDPAMSFDCDAEAAEMWNAFPRLRLANTRIVPLGLVYTSSLFIASDGSFYMSDMVTVGGEHVQSLVHLGHGHHRFVQHVLSSVIMYC